MKAPASLYDALIGVQVPGDKARAVADALESDMTSQLATRQDLELLRHDMEAALALTRHDMEAALALTRRNTEAGFALVREEMKGGLALLRAEFKQDLAQQTVKLGVMMAGGLTLLFAALKLVP